MTSRPFLRGPLWSAADDDALRRMYADRDISIEAICAHFSRSRSAILARANKLKLPRPTPGEPPRLIEAKRGAASIWVAGLGGQIVTLDAADVDWFLTHPFGWMSTGFHGHTVYVVDRSRSQRLLHRMLLGAPDGVPVDHIDRNGLNNRRANLRLVTAAQNNHNSGPRRNARSQYKGVWLHGLSGLFCGVILGPDGHRHSIGYHRTEEAAARAHDALARMFRGEFAYLNFPDNPMSDDDIMRHPSLRRAYERIGRCWRVRAEAA